MLQRFNIALDDQTNRLKIQEFAFLKTKSHRRDDYQPIKKDFSLIHEVSYNSDNIRAAIESGQRALISVLRTKDFFPVYPCVEIIAKKVTRLFSGHPEPSFEVFFDDRAVFATSND